LIATAPQVRIGHGRQVHHDSLSIAHLADITPDVSLLAKVGKSGHSVAEAVAELVDNAIDARVGSDKVHVSVEYDVRDGCIVVSDDGCGMNRKDLCSALVLGLSAKSNGQIGRFGLGMKTACSSLGARFRVTTAREDASLAWVADYDEEAFIGGGEWVLPVKRQKKAWRRGTHIWIKSDRVYHGLEKSLNRNLGSVFRHFIETDVLELDVNEAKVEPLAHNVDPESVLPLNGEVAGRPVRGWVGLLRVSSQRGWYGFDLVRHRRVIRRHEKLGFRPHPSTARVTGELHLDEFPTNNLKTDFIRETEDWRELENWLSTQIEPVLSASRALAHAGSFDSNIRAAIASERSRVLDALGAHDLGLPRTRVRAKKGATVAVVLGTLHMAHQFEDAESEDEPHFRVERVARESDADILLVVSNAQHPAMTQSDPSMVACHNLAEAAALERGECDGFVQNKGRLLAALLKQTALRRALKQSSL
jgi:hypothetical protein